jgi:hypothetical protein
MKLPRNTAAILALWLVGPISTAWSADPPATTRDDDLRFFETKVRPLLAERCYKCHGEKKQEGDLRLDDYAAMIRGGASGAALVAGKPDESLLIAAVGYQNEELRMPPSAKLPESEVKILREWIQRGTPHPDAAGVSVAPQAKVDLEQGRQFWAFQPPVGVSLPAVRDASWVRTPIDHFILNDLQVKGLQPTAEADKRTWIRRVTFDLIGLPPTATELDEFLADDSPTAWNRVVDRLLSSPRYGERWGRHWLDVVRYADSNGLDENIAHGNAWRYRDYVIAAWNADKPFDRFTREQIAGDLLPSEDEARRHEQLIATGFFALGPKVLAEVDERKMEMDIVDEQIDTFGRAFLGLTLGCARCHDHKFDPVRIDDYYALAGILRSTTTMENFTKIARWHENLIAKPAELQAKAAYDQQLSEKKGAIQKTIGAADQALASSETAGTAALKDTEREAKYPESVKTELKKLREELKQLEKTPPPMSSAMGVKEGTPTDTAVCLRGSHLTPGKTVPRGVPAVLVMKPLDIPASNSGRRELAEWLTDPRNPLLARVAVNRIWRWHFGRGLVESTDNFGKLGDRPTNQPLLDWLAVWFMEHDWSVKELHRLIVGSAVYCQASHPAPPDAVALTVDPDNRLLWRFPIRRLEAEAIRDSLLLVSDQLDTAMGGSLLHVGNREFLFDHTSKDNTKYDSRQRTVYLPVIRNNQYDVCQLFDATDATVPSGDRAASTVPTQALFMLNSNLVFDAGRGLADAAQSAAADDRLRIHWLFPRCFGRAAGDADVDRCLDFLAKCPQVSRGGGQREAWTALCQILLASNEFIYVR